MQLTRLVVLLFVLLKAFVQASKSNNCVALTECPQLLFLLRNRDDLADSSRYDIYKHLKEHLCGFEDMTPLFTCQAIQGKPYFYNFLHLICKKFVLLNR